MQIWMLTQFYNDPVHGFEWPVAASYGNGHVCPRHPDDPSGWALCLVNAGTQQVEAAEQDPRVQPYRTLWDPLTAETVAAYAAQGAKAGMMLGQLIQLLAQTDMGYMVQ